MFRTRRHCTASTDWQARARPRIVSLGGEIALARKPARLLVHGKAGQRKSEQPRIGGVGDDQMLARDGKPVGHVEAARGRVIGRAIMIHAFHVALAEHEVAKGSILTRQLAPAHDPIIAGIRYQMPPSAQCQHSACRDVGQFRILVARDEVALAENEVGWRLVWWGCFPTSARDDCRYRDEQAPSRW
jgi:hypothetical protein